MARYFANVTATSLSVAGGENWVEILTASQIFIDRVLIYHTDGTQAALSERTMRITFAETSTTGNAGIASTPTAYNANAPPSTCTVMIKDGSTAFRLGTQTTTFDTTSCYRYHNFEFLAKDYNDMISVTAGQRFTVQIDTSVSGVALTVRVSWRE